MEFGSNGSVKTKVILQLSGLGLLMLVAMVAGLFVGSTNYSVWDTLSIIFGGKGSTDQQIFLNIRLPRILYAAAVGGGLSVSGAILQALLKNPLAEPYILGISSGAGFGAILALALGLGLVFMQAFSFLGAMTVLFVVFIIGKRFGEMDSNVMLLSGVMVGAFFSSAILVLMISLQDSLRTAVFWMMGNLSLAHPGALYFILPGVILITIYLTLISNQLNALALGNDTAKSLGVNVNFIINTSYILTGLLISGLVASSGIIGFVGLLIPHLCRLLFGADNRVIVPASFFTGAIYLTLCDAIARTIAAPTEVPIGAVTAFIGAPIFIYLLRKRFNIIK